MTRILITNDDGIGSPGIRHLARAARDAGLGPVVVAAPRLDSSGSSASITLTEHDGKVKIEDRELSGLPEVTAYAVAAPPGLIALIATRGAFGPAPDLLLSGINRGANTGRAVLHSGTVGAALTAAANGRPAVAVSLDVGLAPDGEPHWATAERLTAELLPTLVKATTNGAGEPGARPVILNLNAPDLPYEEVRGLREAGLASFGVVQTHIEAGDGYVRMTLADSGAGLEVGSDTALLAEGYATMTALAPVCGVPAPALYRQLAGALDDGSR